MSGSDKPKILIAEDDPIIAFDLCDIVSGAGFEVVGPARTVTQVVQLAETPGLRGALLDVRLKDGHVFAGADRLQELDVPVAFHTGNTDLVILKERWPEAILLSKPSPPSAIVEAITAIAQTSTARRDES